MPQHISSTPRKDGIFEANLHMHLRVTAMHCMYPVLHWCDMHIAPSTCLDQIALGMLSGILVDRIANVHARNAPRLTKLPFFNNNKHFRAMRSDNVA